MGWSATLDENSAVGTSVTLTPDTYDEGAYTVKAFTAPKKGIYRFLLKASGGTNGASDAEYDGSNGSTTVAGGKGGKTDGYLLLEKGETVYIGVGGTCSAAFVAKANGSKLSAISAANLYFVAGAGGAAGRAYKGKDEGMATTGGNGGGTSGSDASNGGKGGTQLAGGEPGGTYSGVGNAGVYGDGGAGSYSRVEYQPSYAWGGRGGDGYYGGGSGYAVATHNSGTGYTGSYGYGGGGGAAYIKKGELIVGSNKYYSTTSQGDGAGAGSRGSAVVTYYARAELPIVFNGTQIERLFYNGTEIGSTVFNGTKLFIERIKRKVSVWFMSIRTEIALRIPT